MGLMSIAAKLGITFGPKPPIAITVSTIEDLHHARRLLIEGETVVVNWGAGWLGGRGKIYLEGVADALDLAKYQPQDEFGKNLTLYGDPAAIMQYSLDFEDPNPDEP